MLLSLHKTKQEWYLVFTDWCRSWERSGGVPKVLRWKQGKGEDFVLRLGWISQPLQSIDEVHMVAGYQPPVPFFCL